MFADAAKAPLPVERRSSIRFPILASVKYEIDARAGTSRTLDISSGGIAIQTDAILPAGRAVRVFINWPAPLDGRLPLSLVIDGNVLRSTECSAVVAISRYEFRLHPGKPNETITAERWTRSPAPTIGSRAVEHRRDSARSSRRERPTNSRDRNP